MKKVYGIVVMMFLSIALLNAQQEPGMGKPDTQMGMTAEMQNCMASIAADSTLRMQMMSKMMESTSGDTLAMMQMGKKMMNNPAMQKMMMKMMHSDGMGSGMQKKMDDHMMKPKE